LLKGCLDKSTNKDDDDHLRVQQQWQVPLHDKMILYDIRIREFRATKKKPLPQAIERILKKMKTVECVQYY